MGKAIGIALFPIACALGGCFPDYEIAKQSSEAPIFPYMHRVYAESESFAFKLNTDIYPDLTTARFSYDFDMDRYEVSVRRYKDWLESGSPLPCNGCSLDPDGPYAEAMRWDPSWNTAAKEPHYDLTTCSTPAAYGPWTTYGAPDNDDFPMVCVSWLQAAAFCAWDEKRLPTEAEWLFAATAHGDPDYVYPWGNETPDCSLATIEGCAFPTNVGTVPRGASIDGIEDLAGSVFEWVWDATWDLVENYPAGAEDHSGPDVGSGPGSLDRAHFRNGGAYFDPPTEPRLKNDLAERDFVARNYFADAGFRCAKTVR
jgi:formylglycine-generating enzyme required for sulfatase activity